MSDYNPLVSVTVITYNSSNYVLETLESIKGQTYQNLELIISDDCSTDKTVEICRKWLDEHKERFVRTELVTVTKNTGVSANCNRADASCLGDWIKVIAGDDIMLPNCVYDCIDYISLHPETIILFGKVKPFGSSEEVINRVSNYFDYNFFDKPREEQLQWLIFQGNCIPAPAAFVNRQCFRKLQITNDERIPLLEDWPKWINLLRVGVKFHFLDKDIVRYRISTGSLSTAPCISEGYKKSLSLFFIYYQFPVMIKESNDKLSVLHRYVRAKKSATGHFYWYVINRLMKICGI